MRSRQFSPAAPWFLVQEFANQHCFYLRDVWFVSKAGLAFLERVDEIIAQDGVSAPFREAVKAALAGSDACIMEFFHNRKAISLPTVCENLFVHQNVPRVVLQEGHCDNLAWRALDTLFTSDKRGPTYQAFFQLKLAIQQDSKLCESVHTYCLIDRMRELTLFHWNNYEDSRYKTPTSLIIDAQNSQSELIELGWDVRALNDEKLQTLYIGCCQRIDRDINALIALSRALNNKRLLVRPCQDNSSLMVPEVTKQQYQRWLWRSLGSASSVKVSNVARLFSSKILQKCRFSASMCGLSNATIESPHFSQGSSVVIEKPAHRLSQTS